MDSFTRKNLMRISVSFEPIDGSGAEPTSAACSVNYRRKDGKFWSENFPLTKEESTGLWIGHWDSSKAAAGEIDWVAECQGPVMGAVQGTFLLEANRANK